MKYIIKVKVIAQYIEDRQCTIEAENKTEARMKYDEGAIEETQIMHSFPDENFEEIETVQEIIEMP